MSASLDRVSRLRDSVAVCCFGQVISEIRGQLPVARKGERPARGLWPRVWALNACVTRIPVGTGIQLFFETMTFVRLRIIVWSTIR